MKFKKIATDKSNAHALCDFMKSIYINPITNKPITMALFVDNPISSNIIVLNDKVISTLVEDRGLAPTEAWNMFTFMDMMDKAGYEIVETEYKSDMRIFTLKDSSLCDACMKDCKYTGSNRLVPVYTQDGPEFVCVRMCPSCSNKFKAEFDRLIDILPGEAKDTPKKCEAVTMAPKQCESTKAEPKKEGPFKKFFNKLLRR